MQKRRLGKATNERGCSTSLPAQPALTPNQTSPFHSYPQLARDQLHREINVMWKSHISHMERMKVTWWVTWTWYYTVLLVQTMLYQRFMWWGHTQVRWGVEEGRGRGRGSRWTVWLASIYLLDSLFPSSPHYYTKQLGDEKLERTIYATLTEP